MANLESRRDQATRTKRTADLLCSAHANLRDRFRTYAAVLDTSILLLSAFVVAHSFGIDKIPAPSNFFGLRYDLWLAFASVGVFGLSIVQLRVNWKEIAAAHAKSYSAYAEVKHDLGRLLSDEQIDEAELRVILSRYALASEIGTNIPEAEFLKQKQQHKLKIEISRYLDDHPGTWIALIRLKLFLRDTFGDDANRKLK